MSIYHCDVCDLDRDADVSGVNNVNAEDRKWLVCDDCYTDHLSALIDRKHLLLDTYRLRKELDECKGVIR